MLQDSLSPLQEQPGLKMPPSPWLATAGGFRSPLPSCKAARVAVVPSWLLLHCCKPRDMGQEGMGWEPGGPQGHHE